MARKQYSTDPSVKQFDQVQNFSGGINQGTSDDNMLSTELKNITNFDLDFSGALEKRPGFQEYINSNNLVEIFGTSSKFINDKMQPSDMWKTGDVYSTAIQGLGTFYKENESKLVTIIANQFYEITKEKLLNKMPMFLYDENSNAYTNIGDFPQYTREIPTDTGTTIETVKMPLFSTVKSSYISSGDFEVTGDVNIHAPCYKVEFVNYNEKLFCATGHILFEIGYFSDYPVFFKDILTARQIKSYKPSGTEFTKVGANFLAKNPDTFLYGGVSTALDIQGLIPMAFFDGKPLKSNFINNKMNWRAILTRPSENYDVKYKYEFQKVGTTAWNLKNSANNGWEAKTLTNLDSELVWSDFVLNEIGQYSIRISATPTSNIDGSNNVINAGLVDIFTYSNYIIADVPKYKDVTANGLHKCRRLMVYYDQLLAYRDTVDGNVLYISDYRRPDYFPSDYNLIFDTAQNDDISNIHYLYNTLIVFTTHNIFMLKGTNPTDFSKQNINRTIGSISPYGSRVMGNVIFFLSTEGLFKLKALYGAEDRFNIEQIDSRVRPILLTAENWKEAVAIQYNNKFILTNFSNAYNKALVFDPQLDSWTSYESQSLNFTNMYVKDGILYCLKFEKNINRLNKNKILTTPYLPDDLTKHIIYTDENKNYKCRIETKDSNFEKPYHIKKYKQVMFKTLNKQDAKSSLRLYVYVDSKEIITPASYTVYVDEATGEVLYNTIANEFLIPARTILGISWILGFAKLGAGDTSLHKLNFAGKGNSVKYIFEHETNTAFGLLGYATVFKERHP